MSVDYEYVTIDVDLMVHPKAIAAGIEAMGLWLWCMAWSHKTGANGRIPRHVVSTAWGGPPALVSKLAKRLVTSGLWLASDDGWIIWNYGKKNQSAEDKERRRALGRERMKRLRGKSGDALGNAPCDASRARHVRDEDAAPVFDPDLESDLESRSEDPPRETPPPEVRPHAVVPDPLAAAPDWFPAVVERVSADTLGSMTGLAPLECWLAYAGHRANKRLPAAPADAAQWLVTVMVPRAREAIRVAARDRERDAKWSAQREAERTPQAAPYHATPGRKTKAAPVPLPTDADRERAMAEARERLGVAELFVAPANDRTGTDE